MELYGKRFSQRPARNVKKEGYKMKPRLTITIVVLCLFLSTVLMSCSYTNRIWGDWGSWGEWRQQGVAESRDVFVSSKPGAAHVYINGTLAGDTPITLSLRCPVLKSQRVRTQYDNYVPGIVEFILLSRPKTSPVSSEKEERTMIGSQTYTVEVRKEGHISVRRNFSVPEVSSLSFFLKRKPTLAIRPFKITNHVKLSIGERVLDFFVGRKSAIDNSKFTGIERRLLSPALIDAFEVSTGKDADYHLEGEMSIQKNLTELGMVIIDNSGRVIAARKAFVNTTELESLPIRIERLIIEMVEGFLNQQ